MVDGLLSAWNRLGGIAPCRGARRALQKLQYYTTLIITLYSLQLVINLVGTNAMPLVIAN